MDLTTEALRLGMTMARTRAEVASTNIANVDTPGFRPQQADFGSAIGLLQQAARATDMASGRLRAVSEAGFAERTAPEDTGDGTVRLDSEVAELESASVDFQAMSSMLSRRFALMQLALAGKN